MSCKSNTSVDTSPDSAGRSPKTLASVEKRLRRIRYPRTRTVIGFTVFLFLVVAVDTFFFNGEAFFFDWGSSEGFGAFNRTDILTVCCFACFALGRTIMSLFKPVRKSSKGKEQHNRPCNQPDAPFAKNNELDGARQSAVARRNQLIDQAARSGDVAKASELLIEFEESGNQPDVVSYNLLMRACARAGDVSGAWKWLLRMEQRGIESTVCSYNTLLDACAKADLAEECERWLERMLARNLRANVISYATVIHARARRGDLLKAEGWLKRMIAAGVEPDAVTYNVVIHACSVGGHPERAEYWLSEMSRQGLVATVTTYTAVIDANAKKGLLPRAEAIIEQMISDGLQPNVVTYSAVVDACAKANDLTRAEYWHDHMIAKGVQPNAHTYSAVINACGKSKDVNAACRWLDYSEKAGSADVIVYSSMIDACGKAGDAAQAMAVFKRMRDKGIRAHIVAYAALARPFAYKGDWEEVDRIAEILAMDGVRPNEYFVYAQLLAYATARPRQAQRAERCFRKAMQHGLEANDHIVGALTRAITKQRAEAILEELCGGQVSTVTNKPVRRPADVRRER